MNVFFSWSGDRSRDVAAIFNEWLPEAIQAVQPFFSPEIPKGTPWFNEIAKRLESFSFGILFVTRDNLTSPWMMFEAGALFKHFGEAKVCPLLFDDLSPADLQGALPNLNVTRFSDASDFLRLLKTINATLPTPLKEDVLQRTFERIHPELVARISEVLKTNRPPEVEKSPERELLEKILSEVQGGFAQSNRFTDPREVMVENRTLRRMNKEQEQTLTLMRTWSTIEQCILNRAGLNGLTTTSNSSEELEERDLKTIQVAKVFRDAEVKGVDKGRIFLGVSDDVDLNKLSEESLQLAVEAIGALFEPPTRPMRIYLDKWNANQGLHETRHIEPDWMREANKVSGQTAIDPVFSETMSRRLGLPLEPPFA